MQRDRMNMRGNETMSVAGVSVAMTRNARQKNLYVRITPPDGKVTVSAPLEVTEDEIRYFILRKMPEITKVRGRMLAQLRESKREYVSGEACYLWGKPYMLQVIYEGSRCEIEKTPQRIIMRVPEGTTDEKRKKALTEWYRLELKRVLPCVLTQCEERIGVKASACNIKYMKTRWGSCNIEMKRILINLQLVHKPVECLWYVVTHELVHLLEKNHSNRFWALLDEYWPNWKEARQLLIDMPLAYMNNGEDEYACQN